MLRARGYVFVTLDQVLKHKVYRPYLIDPPLIPLKGDRNFLNQVALSRGISLDDPSGSRHFAKYWKPRIDRLIRAHKDP